jgi:hypothetical protein
MTLQSGFWNAARAALVLVVLLAGAGPAMAGARVYVRIGPPAPVVQVRTVAPGPRHGWVPGYHRWGGRAHVWVPGHWVVPPRPRAVWVAPRWVHHRAGWYFVAGHWR